MRKESLILLVCLLFSCTLFAQRNIANKLVNWGFKVGFNSAIPDPDIESDIGGLNTKTMNKVGYLGEAFVRINMNRVYFQPELGCSVTKENIYIQRDYSSNYSTLKINVNAIDASGVIGYNTVKQGPYLLNVFAGCKFKHAFEIKTEPSNAEKYTDADTFYNLYATLGLGVNISRLFFDFRYEYAIFDNETDITNHPPDQYGSIKINRKANILSFSMGFMF